MSALMGCMGVRLYETQLLAIEEAVKDNATERLLNLLAGHVELPNTKDHTVPPNPVPIEELNRRNILHQAAWLGHSNCTDILLEHGCDPNHPHKKNGCTPLHLAHFCTIEDTSPAQTIKVLVEAGGDVNNAGSSRCGKSPLDHAIQHQRFDSVQVLLRHGARVALQSVLIAIDVANPSILELLLLSGAECGPKIKSSPWWGQGLHRVLYTPLKCPRECYRQMFQMLVQADVSQPLTHYSAEKWEKRREATNEHLVVETELRQIALDHVELTKYLYAALLRNGFYPTPSIRVCMDELGPISWVGSYLDSVTSLRDLAVRVLRSRLRLGGNVLCGAKQLALPKRLQQLVLLYNPL